MIAYMVCESLLLSYGFGPVCFDSGILDYIGLDCSLRASSTLSSILECDSLILGFENWLQSCLDRIR